jgi:anti-sigma B factor antagonist
MATALKIEAHTTESGSGVLSLRGEVDVANSHEVRDAALALVGGGARGLVVDLTGTAYLDSAGLGILVGLLKRSKEADFKLAIAGAQPAVQRLFEITKLNRVFPMHADVASALQEVAG